MQANVLYLLVRTGSRLKDNYNFLAVLLRPRDSYNLNCPGVIREAHAYFSALDLDNTKDMHGE